MSRQRRICLWRDFRRHVSELSSAEVAKLILDGGNIHLLFKKAIREEPMRSGGSAIKTKHKFIQIVAQMRSRGFTLMRTDQPSLQQSHNSISQGQQIFTNFSRLTNDRMEVASRGQSSVSLPSIGSDFAVKLNAFFDRGNQAGARGVFDFMETRYSQCLHRYLSIFELQNS